MNRAAEARRRFESEAALCSALIEAAPRYGWTPYPETGGFDVLLVSKEGLQAGVEAKLNANLDVLSQCVDRARPGCGVPHWIAVLVPYATSAFETIARALGVTIIEPPFDSTQSRRSHWSGLVRIRNAKQLEAEKRCWVPPFVPDVPAGVPCPIRLTQWKVNAIRVCAKLRAQGYITAAQIAELGCSPTWWRQNLDRDGKIGRHDRLVLRPGVALPDENHPEIAARIAAGAA